MIYIVILILIVILIIYLKNDKRKFKTINFKNKKLYLCCLFLHGTCNLKTNKAVISRNEDEFLIETEDNNSVVESFKFNKNDVKNIEIKENLSSKSSEQLWNNFTSADAIGRHTTFTPVKTIKFYKVYDITILLNNDIKMHIQSTKSPYYIFD